MKPTKRRQNKRIFSKVQLFHMLIKVTPLKFLVCRGDWLLGLLTEFGSVEIFALLFPGASFHLWNAILLLPKRYVSVLIFFKPYLTLLNIHSHYIQCIDVQSRQTKGFREPNPGWWIELIPINQFIILIYIWPARLKSWADRQIEQWFIYWRLSTGYWGFPCKTHQHCPVLTHCHMAFSSTCLCTSCWVAWWAPPSSPSAPHQRAAWAR